MNRFFFGLKDVNELIMDVNKLIYNSPFIFYNVYYVYSDRLVCVNELHVEKWSLPTPYVSVLLIPEFYVIHIYTKPVILPQNTTYVRC